MNQSRAIPLLGVLAALVLILAACAATSSDGGGGSDTGETVSMAGTKFTPSSLTIPVGTTVTFTDTSGHTVTEGTSGQAVDNPIVDQQGGSDVVVSFDEAGTYNITCKIHSSMNMTITVEG